MDQGARVRGATGPAATPFGLAAGPADGEMCRANFWRTSGSANCRKFWRSSTKFRLLNSVARLTTKEVQICGENNLYGSPEL